MALSVGCASEGAHRTAHTWLLYGKERIVDGIFCSLHHGVESCWGNAAHAALESGKDWVKTKEVWFICTILFWQLDKKTERVVPEWCNIGNCTLSSVRFYLETPSHMIQSSSRQRQHTQCKMLNTLLLMTLLLYINVDHSFRSSL